MTIYSSDDYDYDLPKEDDCWHLDAPHQVTIKLKSEDRVVTEYTRVGINARNTSKLGAEGEGVTVAIFDTGVDYKHPSLVQNINYNDAIDFDNNLEPEGRTLKKNGQIDNKFNAHGTACAGLIGAVNPADSEDPRVRRCRVVGIAPRAKLLPIRISTNFHIESLLGALRYAGDRADIILMPRFLPHVDDAPRHGKETGVKEPSVADLEMLIKEIASKKPIICASGNDGTSRLVYPASLAETIAVGACNDRGYRSTYSQFGEGLDVVAPSNDLPVEDRSLTRLDTDEVDWRDREKQELNARLQGRDLPRFEPQGLELLKRPSEVSKELGPQSQEQNSAKKEGLGLDQIGLLSIATTDNQGDFGYNSEPPGDYCKATGDFGFGGTSAAAAQVAGVVALMLATNPKLRWRPDAKYDPNAIRTILHEASSHKYLAPDLSEESKSADGRIRHEFGFGLIDAERAVELASAWPDGSG